VLIGRSPVRISFGGGGTDLPSYYEQFGGAVLSVAINKYFYTVVGKRTDGRVQVISSDLRLFENWRDVTAMSSRGSDLEIPLAVSRLSTRIDTLVARCLVSKPFGRDASAARIAACPWITWSGVIGRAMELFCAKQSAAPLISPRSRARE